MKIRGLYLIFAVSLLTCKEAPTVEAITTEEEESAPITLAVLEKNERVEMGKIQQKEISQTINCTGKIEIPPTELTSIHSKINGQITYLKYLPGDYVKKGNLLAIIEQPKLIEKQRLFLETKANLDFAKKDFERKKILKAGDATAEKTFDESQNKVELLTATYEGLKQELILLGIQIESLEKEMKFQPTVNVYASNSGYIHEISVNKGQMITPEQELMDISNNNHLHLELQILSKDIAGIHKGQKVQFSIPNQAEIFNAEIVKINPMVDDENATLQVHCHLEATDKAVFFSGLFVNATIEKERTSVEGLPLSGVIKEGEDYFAYKIKGQEVVRTMLKNASVSKEFVQFEGEKDGIWITKGAYYIE